MSKKGRRFLAAMMSAVMLGGSLSAFTPSMTEVIAAGNTSIGNLTLNYQKYATGVETGEPILFSWNMTSDVRGQKQKSYKVDVTDANGNPVWASETVETSKSVAVSHTIDGLAKEAKYTWTVTVETEDGQTILSEANEFITDTDMSDTDWIIPVQEDGKMPLLRKETALEQSAADIESAYLYISSMGTYTAYLDGLEVMEADGSNDIFNPGWTDYRYYTNYQTYDVKDYIQDNTVTIGAELAKGWYAGRVSINTFYQDSFGPDDEAKELGLIAKLAITYTDGSKQYINTDNTWESSIYSPVTANDFFDGEDYDARIAKEISGWNNDGYQAGANENWTAVTTGTYKGDLRSDSGAAARIADEYDITPVSAFTYNDADTLTAEAAGNDFGAVVKTEVDLSGPITLTAGDKLIIDFGQNASGILQTEFGNIAAAGGKVTFRHAEMLNDGRDNPTRTDGGSDGPEGTLYYEALRGALATDNYILSDEATQTYLPTRIFHGFQYAEISADVDIQINSIKTKVITSVGSQTGYIDTNNADINKLFRNALWSQMANYITVPTDCPQRNERVAWTGDAQLFAATGVYNFDSYAFLNSYNDILQKSAAENTSYGVVTPTAWQANYGAQMSSGWSDAGVIIPWVLYQQTGNASFIADNYNQMATYMEAVNTPREVTTADRYPDFFGLNIEDLIGQTMPNSYNIGMYGDWLAFNPASMPCVNSLYQIYVNQLMEKMATMLGKTEEAESYKALHEGLKDAFITRYIDEDGNVLSASADGMLGANPTIVWGAVAPCADNAQTAILLALKCGLYKDEEQRDKMIGHLIANIKNEGKALRPNSEENTLGVGFLGINVILPVLVEIGAADVAYDLLLQNEMPSWLYSVQNGATTIWERWNSYSIEDSFGSSGMNSFNHYSYGACVEWMYKYMGGISIDEANPGFQNIILQPLVDESGRITDVNSSYDSLYGKIESNWKAEDGCMTQYDIKIPANTSATLYLPVSEANAKLLEKLTEGITYEELTVNNGMNVAKFSVESGTYELDKDVLSLQKTANGAQKELEEAEKAAEEAQKAAEEAEKKAEEAQKKADAAEATAKKAQEDASKSAAETAKLKDEAEKAQAEATRLKAEADKAQAAAKKAQDELEAARKNVGVLAPKKGTTATAGNLKYKVTKSALTNGTVTLTGPTKKTLTKVTIPATVKINGVTFRVTAIADKAFAKNKKLTTLTIGKNIRTIGKQAFNGNTKLKTITINSSSITKMGSSAFKNIHRKATIKVPSKKLSSYKKMLRKAGVKNTATIRK